MPKKIPLHAVVVVRNGKQVTATPGVLFDFTAEEVAELADIAPDALRDPVNEAPAEAPAEAEAKPKATKQAKGDL
jgi:hypothetical protein